MDNVNVVEVTALRWWKAAAGTQVILKGPGRKRGVIAVELEELES
jgi:hypothetical protein